MSQSLDDDQAQNVAGGRQCAQQMVEPEMRDDTAHPTLFRKEAFAHAVHNGYGRPIARMPITWTAVSLLLLLLVIMGAAVLLLNSYERRETVRGILRPATGEVHIYAQQAGTASIVAVEEGELVRAGDTLIMVSTERTEIAGKSLQEDMLRSLERQEASIRRRLAALDSAGGLADSAAESEIMALMASLNAARADLTSAHAQLEMAEKDYERARPLAERGFVSQSDMLRREQSIILGRQAVANAQGLIARIEAQIAGRRSAAAQRPFTTVREAGNLEDMLAEVEQRRAQYELGRGYSVRAPISGRVTTLQASEGQLVDSSRPVMTIVSEDAEMVAVLYVPSRGIGFVRPGQSVRLRYDAFPFQRFGAANARVKSVSQTVLRPEEVSGAVQLQEPAYTVVAVLDDQKMAAYGEAYSLHPGMALTADIVAEERSFAAWLFEPLLALKGRL